MAEALPTTFICYVCEIERCNGELAWMSQHIPEMKICRHCQPDEYEKGREKR